MIRISAKAWRCSFARRPTARASGVRVRNSARTCPRLSVQVYKEIASNLGIALDTVRKHLRSIYDKLHVRSRSEAIVKYLKK